MARKSGVGIPRWLVLIALLAGGVYLLRGRGDGMFFSPDSDAHGTPARYDLEVEKVRFAARDGPQLSGWWVPAPGGRGTRGPAPEPAPDRRGQFNCTVTQASLVRVPVAFAAELPVA